MTWIFINPKSKVNYSALRQMLNPTPGCRICCKWIDLIRNRYVAALYYLTRMVLQLPLPMFTEILALTPRTSILNIDNPNVGQV